jgi:hypothetical protein
VESLDQVEGAADQNRLDEDLERGAKNAAPKVKYGKKEFIECTGKGLMSYKVELLNLKPNP